MNLHVHTTVVARWSHHVANVTATQHHMVSRHHIHHHDHVCSHVTDGMARIRVVCGQVHHSVTRQMMHAHTVAYAVSAMEAINVLAIMHARHPSMMVVSVTASDMHDRAGVVVVV